MVSVDNPPVILFIEDDPDDRLLFTFEVENAPWFHSIIYLNNSQELLDYLHGRRGTPTHTFTRMPDLILMNAFQFVRGQKNIQAELSSSEEFRKIPVVLMVDSTFEAEYFQLKSRSDIFGWFLKPVNREKLDALIHRITKGILFLLQVYIPFQLIESLIEESSKLA